MTKWICTVCDYIVEGDPPDICPVCGAPISAFEKLDGKTKRFDLKGFLKSLHIHPIAAHLQNGLFPVSLFFLFLYFKTNNTSYEQAAFYVYVVAAVSSPFTFAAGILDWYLRYDSVRAKIFTEKIILSAVLTILILPVMLLRYTNPDIVTVQSSESWLYITGIIVQTLIVGRLGFLGGKLLFS